jgi:plastocyanin
MTRLVRTSIAACTLGILATSVSSAAEQSEAQHDERFDRNRRVVTVAFGAGLNTAQPGNDANHHVIPDVVRVRAGDVVNFVVAGLHVIRVYDRGVKLSDVKDEIPDECETNPLPPATFAPNCFTETPVPVIPPLGLDVYYEGLNSLGPPPPAPEFAPLSLAQNRVEPVAFLEPGRYLVICAVLPHFNDRMYAWVEVSPRGIVREPQQGD